MKEEKAKNAGVFYGNVLGSRKKAGIVIFLMWRWAQLKVLYAGGNEQIKGASMRSLGEEVSQKCEGSGNEHHGGYAELGGRKFYFFIDHPEIGLAYDAEFKTYRSVIKTNHIINDEGHEEIKFMGYQVSKPGVQYGRR